MRDDDPLSLPTERKNLCNLNYFSSSEKRCFYAHLAKVTEDGVSFGIFHAFLFMKQRALHGRHPFGR